MGRILQNMPRLHHFLIDPIQYFRGKQSQVIFDGLQMVPLIGMFSPSPMSQHFPDDKMMIG